MDYCRIADDVELEKNVRVHAFANRYGCEIGDDSQLGTFVEIQKNAVVGARCKISSHSFICDGVHIEDQLFIGRGVMFTNVLQPGHHSGRRSPDGGRLGGDSHPREAASINRLGGGHRLRNHDRRECDHRRRCGGDEGRTARRDLGRQSGAALQDRR